MSDLFRTELDAYEREAAVRIGILAAHEARAELHAHLTADVAARVEMGVPEDQAREEAIRALGDLRTAARSEPAAARADSIALLAAPSLLAIEFFLPQAIPITTHRLFALSAFGWIILSAGRGKGRLGVISRWSSGLVGGVFSALVSLLLAMTDNWTETGVFALGRLGSGSWWELLYCIPMFGLPPLVLFLIVSAVSRHLPGRLELRWVRRG